MSTSKMLKTMFTVVSIDQNGRGRSATISDEGQWLTKIRVTIKMSKLDRQPSAGPE